MKITGLDNLHRGIAAYDAEMNAYEQAIQNLASLYQLPLDITRQRFEAYHQSLPSPWLDSYNRCLAQTADAQKAMRP